MGLTCYRKRAEHTHFHSFCRSPSSPVNWQPGTREANESPVFTYGEWHSVLCLIDAYFGVFNHIPYVTFLYTPAQSAASFYRQREWVDETIPFLYGLSYGAREGRESRIVDCALSIRRFVLVTEAKYLDKRHSFCLVAACFDGVFSA